MTRAEMRAGLDLMPTTWALEQKAAANRQVAPAVLTSEVSAC